MEWTKLLNTRRENIHTHYTFSFHARVHIYSYGYVDIPRQIQLGQPSVNPPRLVLEVGGTSTEQAAMPGELKSPPHLEP